MSDEKSADPTMERDGRFDSGDTALMRPGSGKPLSDALERLLKARRECSECVTAQ